MSAPTKSYMSESQKGGRAPQKRRVWTPLEEICLINALRELVSGGMKADNGFRTGYLGNLEKAIAQRFPGSDLRGDPHIQNKIHVWRKTYGTLTTMLSRTGIGWNDTTNTIDVEDEQVWQAFVLADQSLKSWRYKSWPYFKDWEVIFGKDRATGEAAQAWQDVVNDERSRPPPIEEETPLEQDETESVNINGKSGDGASFAGSKKRKRNRVSQNQNPQNPEMIEMMSSVLSEMNSQIGALVMKVGAEKDAKGQRQNLVNELADIPLSIEDKISVAKKICSDVNDVDIFYGLGKEDRVTMVRMVLDGTYFRQ